MREPEIYISVAERFLSGASAAVAPAHELSGFATYHAFESAGGALVTHYGQRYPVNHKSKLNAFEARARGKSFQHAVASLATTLNALRNSFLYPVPYVGGLHHPMLTLTANQVKHLNGRVKGVVGRVKKIVI